MDEDKFITWKNVCFVLFIILVMLFVAFFYVEAHRGDLLSKPSSVEGEYQ